MWQVIDTKCEKVSLKNKVYKSLNFDEKLKLKIIRDYKNSNYIKILNINTQCCYEIYNFNKFTNITKLKLKETKERRKRKNYK